MSVEANVAGSVPASSTTLMPDVSPVSTPATNGNDSAPSTTNGQAATKPSLDDDLMAVWNKMNPDRHVDGRFKARNGKDQSADTPAAPEATTSTESTADQPADTERLEQVSPTEAAKPPVTTPAIEAPMSWSAETKAKLDSLPPEVRDSPAFRDIMKHAADRDKETHAVISRAGQEIKAFEPLRNVLEQFQETFQRNRLPPHEGVARMLAMERWLGENPADAIMEISRAYRVDLRRLIGQSQAAPTEGQPQTDGQQQGQIDPAVMGLRNELQETRANLSKVMSHLNDRQRQEHEAEQASIRSQHETIARQIADFANEQKDGKVIRPHYEKVRLVMSSLLDSGAAADLQDAYDQACFANKDLRTQLQAEQRAAEDKKRADENAKKVASAKTAASINVKSTVGSATTPKTMDDTLSEIARRHYG